MALRGISAVLTVGTLVLSVAPASAGSLRTLISNLFGTDGITLAPPAQGPSLLNLLVALNGTGLRDDITPLVGVEVSF
jgi:hypothetical protein